MYPRGAQKQFIGNLAATKNYSYKKNLIEKKSTLAICLPYIFNKDLDAVKKDFWGFLSFADPKNF